MAPKSQHTLPEHSNILNRAKYGLTTVAHGQGVQDKWDISKPFVRKRRFAKLSRIEKLDTLDVLLEEKETRVRLFLCHKIEGRIGIGRRRLSWTQNIPQFNFIYY